MNVYPTVKCPYCGNEFTVSIDKKELAESLHVFRCDVDEHPGCGLPFVVGVELKPVVTTKAIEGYRDNDDWPLDMPYEGPVGLQHP